MRSSCACHGAGLNRADLVQRAGFYHAPPGSPPDIPGLEFAGEVVAHGDGVAEPAIGARVFGIAGGGGQAELLAIPASQWRRCPESIDLVTAGSVPEVFVTAHDALVTQCAMQTGEVLLVHAVGSGVGTAAVQLGRATGCTVVGTARTAEKLEQARALGLDHGVLAAREHDPVALATAITDAVGNVDVVLELVGGDYLVTDLAVTGLRGRIALVGMMAGTRTQVDLGALLMKRIRIYGTTLRGRSVEEKAAATVRLHARRRAVARERCGRARDRARCRSTTDLRPTSCWRRTRCSAASSSTCPDDARPVPMTLDLSR